MAENWNCSGSGPHKAGEVRLYPYGGGANGIYCRSCWRKENAFRAMRAQETGEPENWPQLDWKTAKVYQTDD